MLETAIHDHDRQRTVRVRGDMTIYAATALKSALLAALSADHDIVLELGEVSEIDTAGLQMLALMRREAIGQGSGLALGACSATVQDALALSGLTALFERGAAVTEKRK